jgi:formylglycine-generating enzyme required for sulfatase activity
VTAYDTLPAYTGLNVPTNNVSWYEAAQFVNWLNTSTSHHAAYNFTGAQGTNNYTLATWIAGEADGGTNLYRHKDAFYYLPTENEWVKAAYWNGIMLQSDARKAGQTLFQGNGTNGGWNYLMEGDPEDPGPAGPVDGPWNVGSSSQELNGTYDMMGNVREWMESPYGTSYTTDAPRGMRGGSFSDYSTTMPSSYRTNNVPSTEFGYLGFRVASEIVPEPGSSVMLAGIALTALLYWWRKRA